MSRPVETAVSKFLAARARVSPLEIAFWAVAFASIWLLPTRHLILTEIAIWGLFALSLDLILGYAGIISLGHAAFFGAGAYAAGLLAKHGVIVEPVTALVCAGLITAVLGFATSFLVLRGSDLTRLMVTLGVALVCYELANKFSDITGGADGLQDVTIAPVFGVFAFDKLFGHTAYVYTLVWLFVLFMLARRIVHSPFGLSLKAIKGNALRASAVGIAVNWRLVAIYTLSAGYAGIAGGLLAQTQAFASLSGLSIDRSADGLLIIIIGGTGYLYGGLIGALIYRLLQDSLASFQARFWQLWIGFILIMMVLFGRVYGGIIAAAIISVTIWIEQYGVTLTLGGTTLPSSTLSILVLVGSLLVLGLIQPALVKAIALAEQRALQWYSNASRSYVFEAAGALVVAIAIGGLIYLFADLDALTDRLQQTAQSWRFWIVVAVGAAAVAGRRQIGEGFALVDARLAHMFKGLAGKPKPAASAPETQVAGTPVLETRHLDKRFGGIVASNDISLAIRKGARHALIGPNGAGKTTFVNLLTGVLRPSGGEILLDGAPITRLEAHRRVRLGIARTFQINQLFADLTPVETLGLAISERLGSGRDWWRIAGSRSGVTAEVADLLERFRLVDVMTDRTAILPYGKQRLLEIAVAFACRPRVLLLDEPAAGVPEAERHDILATIEALPADVTVLLIEHDMDIVFSFADRISVLVNGELFVEGPPDEVARDPRVKAVYLGEALDG
jgi:branched-chain amino acid transport system permease protein